MARGAAGVIGALLHQEQAVERHYASTDRSRRFRRMSRCYVTFKAEVSGLEAPPDR
jgi:hypothetical protein